jgi:hypothetical protein
MINWTIKPVANTWVVEGEHLEFGRESKFERYQFKTLEWAKVCFESMHRLTKDCSVGLGLRISGDIWTDGVLTESTMVTKEYLEERLLQERLAYRLAQWFGTACGLDYARTKGLAKQLWYGDNSRLNKASQ